MATERDPGIGDSLAYAVNAPNAAALYLERIYMLEDAYNKERDRADAAEAERDALRDAAKVLQRVQFILGGHSGVVTDCDDGALRLNATRALELMDEKLPPIVAALARKEPR